MVAEDGAPGFCTVTFAVPAALVNVESIKAVTWVELRNPVAIGDPFQFTTEPDTKPEPVTVSWNAAPPATADGGLRLEMTGAFGVLMVKAAGELEAPPGLVTRTNAVPALATRDAGTNAVSCVALFTVVERLLPFQTATEPAT